MECCYVKIFRAIFHTETICIFSGAKGQWTARVVSPSGAWGEAFLQKIDDGQYGVTFIHREIGIYLVHVLFEETPIQGSPFKIYIGKIDAGKVTASWEGLSRGKTGEVERPSKVKLECFEVDEGYDKPTAPGHYYMCIKYAGTNIAGSPFLAKIEGNL